MGGGDSYHMKRLQGRMNERGMRLQGSFKRQPGAVESEVNVDGGPRQCVVLISFIEAYGIIVE